MCISEKQPFVDQLPHPALVLLTARPEFFRMHGTVDATWRRRGARTFGPYYRLRYREGGRVHCIYLGRSNLLVNQVRQTLHELQRPLREYRAVSQLRRQVRDALSIDRRIVKAHLCRLGLRLKGFEVRGWRTSPLRVLAPLFNPARRAVASMQIKPFRLPRLRQLRFIPKGPAAKWFRQNSPKIPSLPEARLKAVIAWRNVHHAFHAPRL
jgi:hypothetical protein